MKFLIISLLAVTSLFSGEVAEKTPKELAAEKDVMTLLNGTVTEAVKAHDDYQAKLLKLSDKAIADLKVAKDKAMKASNLELAVAIDAKIKEIGNLAIKEMVANKVAEREANNPLAETVEQKMRKALVGDWTVTELDVNDVRQIWQANITVSRDLSVSVKGEPTVSGNLIIEKDAATIKWSTGYTFTFKYDSKTRLFKGNAIRPNNTVEGNVTLRK